MSIQRREVRLTKTKTSSPRIVPLSDVAVSTLVGTPRHITAPYVFWHHDGQRIGASVVNDPQHSDGMGTYAAGSDVDLRYAVFRVFSSVLEEGLGLQSQPVVVGLISRPFV